MGATADAVLSVDTDGRLTRWRAIDGQKSDEERLDATCHGLDVALDGVAVVAAQDEVIVVRPGGTPGRIPLPGASVVAFGPNSGSLGVGTSAGTFHAVDPNSGGQWGQIDLGAPVTGVTWNSKGHWLVAAGDKLHRLSGDGQTSLGVVEIGGETQFVACTKDGVFAATASGTHVLVYELENNQRVATISFERAIGGLGFGSGAWLGIGLDDGDLNRIDLYTGHLTKNTPHVGRKPNHWGVQHQVDAAAVRGVTTRAKVGGGPIAERIYHKYEEPPPEKKGPSCLLMGFIAMVVFVVCSSLGTCVFGLWWNWF